MIEPSRTPNDDQRQTSLRSVEILERITDAFVALDADWRCTYVNRKAAELFGRTPDDLIGKPIWTEFPEGVGRPFYHTCHKAMAEQTPVQIEEYYPSYDRWFEKPDLSLPQRPLNLFPGHHRLETGGECASRKPENPNHPHLPGRGTNRVSNRMKREIYSWLSF